MDYEQNIKYNDEEYKIDLSKDIYYINENNEAPPKIYDTSEFQPEII